MAGWLRKVRSLYHGQRVTDSAARYVGWVTGFEPATSGATVRRSATELHPPFRTTHYYTVRKVR